jgi:MFS family permease
MSVNDPHADPSTADEAGFELTGPRAVPAGHGWQWIADGFGHFKRNPWAWIGAFVVWFVVLIVLSLIPLLGWLATMLLTYVFIGGFILGCREQAQDRDFTVGHLFAAFSSHLASLVWLSVLYGVLIFAVMGITMGGTYFSMMAGNEAAIPEDPSGMAMSFLLAMALLIPVLMAFWFAPTLIVNNNVPVFQSLALSFKGCLKNIIPFLVYGILVFVLSIVAAIPFGLGYLILAPVLLASNFTAYRDIYNG